MDRDVYAKLTAKLKTLVGLKKDVEDLNSNMPTTYKEIYGSDYSADDAEVGIYYRLYASAQNAPDTGVLFTYGDSSWKIQILFSATKIYIRNFASDIWGEWKYVALS